jgi:hypothetical protein
VRTSVIAAAVAAFLGCAGPAAAQFYQPNSTYANPDSTTTSVYQNQRRVCRDPWVTIALTAVFGSADPVHCDIRNFNNGQWNDYNQLIHAVGRYKADLDSQRVQYFAAVVNGQSKVLITANGQPFALANPGDLGLEDRGRGQLVAAGGGNLVAAGGGNLVAAGGGNLVAAGGGNILGNAGGNVVVGLPPANFGNYALQGGRNVRVGSRVISAR